MMSKIPAIVARFAPVIAHKAHREWPAADRITPIGIDGDFSSVRHNPTKLLEATQTNGRWRAPAPEPVIYFSHCETRTHHFILWAIYHPMDWWKRLDPDTLYDLIRNEVDEHAHDMEGALLVVRKEPTPTLDALVTVAHQDFHLYVEPRVPTPGGRWKLWGKPLRLQSFQQKIDGHAWVDPELQRPKLYVESRGHGVYGDHARWGGGDEIWYYQPDPTQAQGGLGPIPSGEDAPGPGDARRTGAGTGTASEKVKRLHYRLEDLHRPGGLWEHRFDRRVFQQRTDGRWGFVAMKSLVKGPSMPSAANPPWSWNDRNDKSPLGEIATDPARLYTRYVQGAGPVDLNYEVNPYLGIGGRAPLS
jgi:hypothetical protein